MKYLIVILSIFLGSCQTVHKTITATTSKVDSISVSTKDTSSISLESILSDSIAIHGLNITINYAKPDPIDTDSTDIDPVSLNELINHPLTGGNIASVYIHIDSLNNKRVSDIRKDSSSVKAITKTSLKTLDQTYNKIVSKTGLSFWIYLAGGILILLVIAFLFFKKIIKI